MSTTIDNKVVEMSFDNSNFEKNVNQSLGTLDKLKKSLNFEGATKGFDNLEKASGRLSFDNLSESIENVKLKFSALEVMAISALDSITKKAVDAGLQLVRSLSVEQISEGFRKYEEKTTAVQTIMSATAETWKKDADIVERANYLVNNGFLTRENAINVAKAYEAVASGMMTIPEAAQEFYAYAGDIEYFSDSLKDLSYEGSQMDYITEVLEKLNWFSDETSYSFVDMTSNIGKFTSNGVALSEAAEAMEGIAVWAAKSGQNSQTAARAMYNLSQAMSVGAVYNIDWKSIEMANMATTEFKQTAIDTAVALGTLRETSEKGIYEIVSPRLGRYDGIVSVTEGFRDSLTEGWFDSDVLMETLRQYGKATTLLSNISDKYGVTATGFLHNLKDVNEGTKSLAQAAKDMNIPVKDLTSYVDTLNSSEYELSLTAFQRAQEAKTFTEAIEATKDAVSTSWMKTFDYIFGNYEEAKDFWTELTERLWDVFAASGETRNSILKLWNEAGGRNSLIEAFYNLWDAIDSVKNSIKSGFDKIFPKDLTRTARMLTVYTTKFKYAMQSLYEYAESHSDEISSIFAGVASVLKLVRNLVLAVLKGFKPLLSILTNSNGTVLSLAAKFGDLATNLTIAIERMGVFEKITNAVGKVTSTVAKVISSLIKPISDLLRDESTVNLSFLQFLQKFTLEAIPSGVINSFITLFETLTGKDLSDSKNKVYEFFSKFSKKFTEFIDFMKTVPKELSNIFEKITGLKPSEAFDKATESIKEFSTVVYEKIGGVIEFFKNIDYSGFEEFGQKVKDFFTPTSERLEKIGNMFSRFAEKVKAVIPIIKSAFNKLRDVIKEKLAELDFDPEKFGKLLGGGGLLAIGIGIKELIDKITTPFEKATSIVNKITGILDAVKNCFVEWQNNIKALTLKQIAISIGIIAASLFVLTLLDSSKLLVSLMALGTAAEMLNLLFKTVTKNAKKPKTVMQVSLALMAMSAALLILTSAIAKLSKIPMEQLAPAFAAIIGLMLGLTVVSNQLSKSRKNFVNGAESLILMSVGILILSSAIKKLSELDPVGLGLGVAAVEILLGTLTAVMYALRKKSQADYTAIGTSILLIAASMLILSKAVEAFGQIGLAELIKGMGSVIVLLVALAGSMKLLSGSSGSYISAGISILLIASAMLILAKAVEAFKGYSLKELAKGIGSIVVILGAFTLAFVAMGAIGPAVLAAGAAMLLGAIALKKIVTTLVFAITALGNMKPEVIKTGLLALVGAFAALAAGALIVLVAVPILLGLGAAILLISVGVFIAASGVALLAGALGLLAGVGAAGIGVLVLAMKSFIELIPEMATAMAKGLINFLKTLVEGKAELKVVMIEMFGTVLEALQGIIPKIVDFLIVLLDEIKRLLPHVIDFLLQLIVDLLAGLAEHADEIIYNLLDFLGSIFVGIATGIPALFLRLAQAMGNEIPNLLITLGDELKKSAPVLRDAIIYLGQSIVEAFCIFFGINSPSTVFADLGKYLMEGLVNGIKGMWNAIKDTIKGIFDKVVSNVKSFFTSFKSLGSTLISKLKEGLSSFSITNFVSDMFNNLITTVKNSTLWQWTQMGLDVISGFIDGIFSGAQNLVDSVIGVCKNAVSSAKKVFKSHSPSKVFMELGEDVDGGFIIGVNNLAGDVAKSTADMGQQAIDAMQGTLNGMSDIFDGTIDDPVIKPVLDLSEIQNGSGLINGLFSDQRMRLAYAADGLGFNKQPDPEEQRYTLQQAVSDAFKTYVPEIINAITASNSDQHFTFDLTPDTRRFYKEIRIQNHKFEREKGYNGLAD